MYKKNNGSVSRSGSVSQKIIIGLIVAAITAASVYLVFFTKQDKAPVELVVRQEVARQQVVAPKPTSHRIPTYPETIKGEIITLKILTNESSFEYYTMFSADVREQLEFPEKITYGYIERYVRDEVERIKKGDMIAYNIWDNVGNKLVGSLQIRELNDWDPGQLGMWINETYRGGGRIQEAIFLISQAYFDADPTRTKYNAHVRPWNPRSERAMTKFGFVKVDDYIEDGEITRHILELYRKAIDQKAKVREARAHPHN